MKLRPNRLKFLLEILILAIKLALDGDGSNSYNFEEIQDYIQDMVFVAYDINGNVLSTVDSSNIKNLRTVETSLVVKSTNELFKKANRSKITIKKDRTINVTSDGHLREIITVSTNTRNILWLKKI